MNSLPPFPSSLFPLPPNSPPPTQLLLTKAQRLLHSGGELTIERLVGLVGREVETVETKERSRFMLAETFY